MASDVDHPSKLIDELLKVHLKPAIIKLGFNSKSQIFFRRNHELIEIISLQKNKWNDSDRASFTINLGVYWPKVEEIFGNQYRTFPPKEYECTLRQRLGSLFNDGNDFWWDVTFGSKIELVGLEVVEKIHNYALPWFKKATDLNEAVKMGRPNQIIAFYFLKGDRAKAKELVEEEISKRGPALAMFQSMALRLGLIGA